MPLNDSLVEKSGKLEENLERVPEPENQDAEDIETPIEAGVQERAEHEFETERKIPSSCKTAIVSVNGRDVDEVPLPSQERAA